LFAEQDISLQEQAAVSASPTDPRLSPSNEQILFVSPTLSAVFNNADSSQSHDDQAMAEDAITTSQTSLFPALQSSPSRPELPSGEQQTSQHALT